MWDTSHVTMVRLIISQNIYLILWAGDSQTIRGAQLLQEDAARHKQWSLKAKDLLVCIYKRGVWEPL